MTERRSQPRLLDCELATVSWECNAVSLAQLANVEDVSPDGIGVLVHEPIPEGASVTVSHKSLFDGVLSGIVRHRAEHPEGILLGIEFVRTTNNPAVHYHPELFIARP